MEVTFDLLKLLSMHSHYGDRSALMHITTCTLVASLSTILLWCGWKRCLLPHLDFGGNDLQQSLKLLHKHYGVVTRYI